MEAAEEAPMMMEEMMMAADDGGYDYYGDRMEAPMEMMGYPSEEEEEAAPLIKDEAKVAPTSARGMQPKKVKSRLP